jgi:hypothetical protein
MSWPDRIMIAGMITPGLYYAVKLILFLWRVAR